MSELAHYAPPSAQVATITPADAATRRLGEWAQSAMAAHEIATSLVQTSFVPEQFRGKPHEATAAILAGIEVGLNPMAALRSFDIIQGTAAPRAITLRAVVQSAGHELVLVESTATRCKMRGKRRGSSEWQEVVWTIDRAQRLGLTSKKNWQNQPEAMLLARATGECARLIASDAILGIGYAVEELDDGDPEATTTAARSAKRTARRSAPVAAVPDPEPEPPLDEPDAPTDEAPEPPADEPPLDDTPDPITRPQVTKLQAGFTELGIKDRDQRLAVTCNIIGRSVISANELTKAEAMVLIDALEAAISTGDASDLLARAGLLEEPS